MIWRRDGVSSTCRPVLTSGRELVIEEGRHPMTELVVPGPFVPNSTCMAEDSARVHVITGQAGP